MNIKKACFYLSYFILIACNNNKNPYINNLGVDPALVAQIDTAHYTLIKWNDSLIEFGNIQVGDSVHVKYKFTNTGKTPLFIIAARASCGCTVTQFPKEPVMPGKSNYIYAAMLGKYTIRKKLLAFKINLPFNIRQFPYIPFSFYGKTFADGGFSYIKPEFESRLNNRVLYTYGFGLDILSLYDINLNIEYGFNQLGENGLFLHVRGGF